MHSVTSSGTQSETRTPAPWYGVLMMWYSIWTMWRGVWPMPRCLDSSGKVDESTMWRGVWPMPRRRVTKSWQEASWRETHVDVGSLKACRRFIWLTMVDGSQLFSVWILEYGSWMMRLPSAVLPVMTMK